MAKNIFINQNEIIHYLKDVRKIKVLTPAREKELAKVMLDKNTSEEVKEKIQNLLEIVSSKNTDKIRCTFSGTNWDIEFVKWSL